MLTQLTGKDSAVGAQEQSEPHARFLDADQFALLYAQTGEAVYRFAWSLVHDSHAAEDVCADVYLQAWRARSSFRGEGSALSWLLSIARNCAFRRLRNHSREEAVLSPAHDELPDTDDEVESLPDRVDAGVLRDAIARLTEDQQKVIFLRFFEGLRHEQIATAMGSNPNAVRALQFRALAQLRKHLEAAHV